MRRAQTTVELPSGGSFVIAGLMQHTSKQVLDQFPGIAQMPVLGALFRSRDFQNNETELVVMVSAYLVNPTVMAKLSAPTDGYQIPTDPETILMGRLNAVYKRDPGVPKPGGRRRGRLHRPIGGRAMWTIKDVTRFASLAALLVAGSCAAPTNDGTGSLADPMANHPISVEPAYHSIKLPYSSSDAGLMPDDSARFSVFVADYLSSGNGAISISAPPGPGANAAIGYFGERLATYGVPRDRILVGTHEGGNDGRVELGFMTYKARVEGCAENDWSTNWGDTADNKPPPSFGCATQKNIAAMVADPRDLIEPRTMDPADATRRNTVLGHYEKGEITQADKRTADKPVEQSGTASSIQ